MAEGRTCPVRTPATAAVALLFVSFGVVADALHVSHWTRLIHRQSELKPSMVRDVVRCQT